MTQNTFEAKEIALDKLFSNDYIFTVPGYQRPYSWTKEEVEALLNDLDSAMSEESLPAPYFLGSIVLKATAGSTTHEVIDGQQRLTTLTMLFCVLRELAQDEDAKDSLDQRVRERPDIYAGNRDRYRLSVRERDNQFFRDNIQKTGSLRTFVSDDTQAPTDAQELLRLNAKYLWDELSKFSQDKRNKLAQFVISNCYLVTVKAYDLESAHRAFSVLNARGRDLLATDILKADVIGNVVAKDVGRYTEHWEDIEDGLGRDEFRDLFAHIYVIETGRRFHEELAGAFTKDVLKKQNGAVFVDSVLAPNAEAFRAVREQAYVGKELAENINRYLYYLSLLDNDDWLPPAMLFFTRFREHPAEFRDVIRALEVLDWSMFVRGVTRDPRILRHKEAIDAAKDDDQPAKEISRLLRTDPDDQVKVVQLLDGPVHGVRTVARFTRPLLQRLNLALSEEGVTYSGRTPTVEHVLPQNPADSSEWLAKFPDEDDRLEWTNRLANLVLLSRNKNARAQNYDFKRKKQEYFQRDGVTTFALTVQVINETEWTPQVLERRQKNLIDVFRKEWDISAR